MTDTPHSVRLPGQGWLEEWRLAWESRQISGDAECRCRMHGGLNTGAKTPEGIERIGEARTKHRWTAKPQLPAIAKPDRPSASYGNCCARIHPFPGRSNR